MLLMHSMRGQQMLLTKTHPVLWWSIATGLQDLHLQALQHCPGQFEVSTVGLDGNQSLRCYNSKMRNKLPRINNPSEPASETEHLISQKPEPEEALLRKLDPTSFTKDRLYVTFTGVIESGLISDEDSLSLMFAIEAAPHWKMISGQKTGISQVGSSYSGINKRIVWNIPFELTYETTVLSGWPQIVFVLTGSDFFGRSVVRAYGNMHLPCSPGKHTRQVQLFKALPQSLITQICGYLNGTIAEYKQAQKVLTSGDGREVTRVESVGELTMSIQTMRYNFSHFGYN